MSNELKQLHKEEKKALQNRELSWLQFNSRILDEAENRDNPLLERAKFLSIVTSNLDEFIQVRYHRVCEKAECGDKKREMGGLKPHKLYKLINEEITRQYDRQYLVYDGLKGELYQEKIRIFPAFFRDETMLTEEKRVFSTAIAPFLRVESFDGDRVRQKQLYVCVKLSRAKGKQLPFRLVALPTPLARVYTLADGKNAQCIIRLQDIIKHSIQQLFPKDIVEHCAVFRILRNQDFAVAEKSQEDIVPAVRTMLAKRISGKVMRIEVEESMSEEMLTLLMHTFHVDGEQVYRALGPIDLNKMMMGLYKLIKRPDLKYDSVKPKELPELMGDDLFERIREQDWLMYHPYHSFEPVVHLLQLAAEDPNTESIQMVLYRVSSNSPIVAALTMAAENGKNVFVLFQAHARFDEENNLYWGEKLARAGCHVKYGIPGLKIHSKITCIRRHEGDALRSYVHLGTGNYNEGTAKLYTDFGLLTSDPQIAHDAELFFRQFDGEDICMTELQKAPDQLAPKLMELIETEKANAADGKPARILAKMNSINDKKMICSLIEAAQAGVQVDLLVRGICCVIPGIEGVTDRLRVRSIVGRNLEHARVFWFENGGESKVFLSSADWMGRNLYKRIELMFPVKEESCREAVEHVLFLQWHDTEKCRHRRKNGEYVLKRRGADGINAQEILLHNIDAVFDGIHPAFEKITEQEDQETGKRAETVQLAEQETNE